MGSGDGQRLEGTDLGGLAVCLFAGHALFGVDVDFEVKMPRKEKKGESKANVVDLVYPVEKFR